MNDKENEIGEEEELYLVLVNWVSPIFLWWPRFYGSAALTIPLTHLNDVGAKVYSDENKITSADGREYKDDILT